MCGTSAVTFFRFSFAEIKYDSILELGKATEEVPKSWDVNVDVDAALAKVGREAEKRRRQEVRSLELEPALPATKCRCTLQLYPDVPKNIMSTLLLEKR